MRIDETIISEHGEERHETNLVETTVGRAADESVDEEYGARGYMAADPEGHVWFFSNYSPGEWWDK